LRYQEEAARAALKQAEEKTYYYDARIELEGRLGRDSSFGKGVWTVTVQGMSWVLDLGNNKELFAPVKKLDGQTVLVTGTGRCKGLDYPSAGYSGPYPRPWGQGYDCYVGPGSYPPSGVHAFSGWVVDVETLKAP
jgi:hypothetical protein